MQREHAALLRLCMLLGETELAIAALSFRESLPLRCTPEFTSEMALVCDELYHPLLETPVANSAVFRRHTLFTGSNASGKSTFIKALAVNAILAQTLGVCAARAFTLPRALAVSSMAVSDNLCAGDSYFVAELKSLRRLLACAQTGMPCLCFIDEILKGTNTVERIAASAAVLRHLAGCRCLCFVATHDRELTEMLAGLYENRHFSEQARRSCRKPACIRLPSRKFQSGYWCGQARLTAGYSPSPESWNPAPNVRQSGTPALLKSRSSRSHNGDCR